MRPSDRNWRRFSWPRFSGVAWLCVGSILLGLFSLGYRSVQMRREARAVEWLQAAGVRVHAHRVEYWAPPIGSTRSVQHYSVVFPPCKTPLTDYEIECLFTLSGVRSLQLAHNPVDDALALRLAGLKSLEELNLCRTRITDVGLEALSRLPSLKHLSIGATATTAEAVRAVGHRRGWPDFYQDWVRWKFWQETGEAAGVSTTELDVTPQTVLRVKSMPLLHELPEMNELIIRQSAPLGRGLLKGLAENTNVRVLFIEGAIHQANAKELGSFRSAVQVKITGPQLDDAVFEGLGELPELETLSVEGGRVTGRGVSSLRQTPKLRSLSVAGEPVATASARTRTSPFLVVFERRAGDQKRSEAAIEAGPAFEALTRLPGLRALTLNWIFLDDIAVGHLSGIPSLHSLNLGTAVLVSEEACVALERFGSHPTLRRISLPDGLTDLQAERLVEVLRRSSSLKEIELAPQNRRLRTRLGDRPGARLTGR